MAEQHPGNLSRERIVEAALQLLAKGGYAAVSMRAIADLLCVTPMALYNHVDGKKDLLKSVADQLLSTAMFDCDDGAWRAQVEHCFRELRRICLQHPALPELLKQPGAAPATVLEPMNVTVKALQQAGLDNTNALRCYFALVSLTLGQSAYQTFGPYPGLSHENEVQSPSGSSDLSAKKAWDFDASFEFSLRLILDGVEAIARTPANNDRKPEPHPSSTVESGGSDAN